MATLSAYMAAARDSALPPDVVDKSKHHILDTFAAMLSGSELPPGRADLALASARDAARLAKRAMELSTIAYKAGATTNLEVIDAARSARDADTAAAQAEDLSRQARLDLLVASGRFP